MQSEALRHDAPHRAGEDPDRDPPCFTVLQDDSSRNVTENVVECMQFEPVSNVPPEPPAASDDALRLAIKLAVDAGEYDRASGLLDVLRRTVSSAVVTPITARRQGPRS